MTTGSLWISVSQWMPWKEMGSAPGLENTVEEAGRAPQPLEGLPRTHKVLSLTPALHRTGAAAAVYTCTPSAQVEETGRSEVQGHLQLHFEHKARLGYRRLCLQMDA